MAFGFKLIGFLLSLSLSSLSTIIISLLRLVRQQYRTHVNYCFSNNFNPDETYLSTIIQNLVDSVGDGCKKKYSEIMDINISSIKAWLSYPKKIKLSTFVYICRVLGKLPSEMFAKRGTINNFSLQPIKKAKRRKQKVDRVMIENELRYYAENTINPPPSLRQVGRTLNYDPTSIMQFFPELGELIKRKHKAYNLEKHNEKVRHRRLEIKKIVEQLVKNGQYPSEHQVEKYLENQFILLLERDYYKNLLKEMKVNRS